MGEVWDASRLADSLGECRERTRKLEAALRAIADLGQNQTAYPQELWERAEAIARAALSDTEDSERQRTPGEERAERFYG
jgi:hypothetical protein